MFKGVETIKFLDVSGAGVRMIPERSFHTLEHLNSLWLDMNGIAFLHEGQFCGLEKLTELNLNSNRIRYVMPGVFQNLPDLEYLYLDNNRIRHLPANMFHGLKKLKHLTLNDNQVKMIDQGALAGLEKIGYIDFERLDLKGQVIPFDVQSKFSKKCEPWEVEYGCNEMKNFTKTAEYFFNSTDTIVPKDHCLTVSQIMNYMPGNSCSKETKTTLCCDGVEYLKEIFGLEKDYWNDGCCGSILGWSHFSLAN